MAKAICGGDLDGFCKGIGGVRPCPDHARVIYGIEGIRRTEEPKKND